ncbi:MAG TPA: hypothetical protein VFQ05_18240 [Candidatus Eisenbacteria bacterium]|nr:hypothetical protein [Candidatus Eisenbacteria bacterium]
MLGATAVLLGVAFVLLVVAADFVGVAGATFATGTGATAGFAPPVFDTVPGFCATVDVAGFSATVDVAGFCATVDAGLVVAPGFAAVVAGFFTDFLLVSAAVGLGFGGGALSSSVAGVPAQEVDRNTHMASVASEA